MDYQQDWWDAQITLMDAYEGDTDLEDCDTEESDEDGVTVVFGQYPYHFHEDDEPDCPADRWDS